jgi:hypothetical protein
METNSTNVESNASWLFDTKFNHIETVAIRCLVISTKNVSISKEVVNGATVTAHGIDCSADGMVTSITVQLTEAPIKMKLKKQTF